ncbi:MAG: sugar ABC transporter permease, partial [Candidatus Rokubacteria bacterium]|nr:sugar ABC transporter permease [Candidatus Rokubacteria bacterium]
MAIGAAAAEAITRREQVREGLYPYLLLLPAMATLVAVALIPFLYTVTLSFRTMSFTTPGPFAGLENYARLLGDHLFWNTMAVTGLIIATAVPLEFLAGLGIALLLHQRIYGRPVLLPILFIPTILAPVVVAIIWKIMLAGSWGFLTYNVLDRFGLLQGTSVFSSPTWALVALVLIDVWEWTPFMALGLFAGLQSLPVNPYVAAAVDGASPWQTFWRLTWSMLTPLMCVLVLLRMIDAFKIFDTVFLLTGGGPGVATETVSLYVYKRV